MNSKDRAFGSSLLSGGNGVRVRWNVGSLSLLLVVCCCVRPVTAQGPADEKEEIETYYVAANYSAPLPSVDGLTCSADTKDKKVGVASALIEYSFDPASGKSQRSMTIDRHVAPMNAAGTVRFWVHGDGSTNKITLDFSSALVKSSKERGEYLESVKREGGLTVTLDFTGWKEFSVNLGAANAGRGKAFWWSRLTAALGPGKERALKGAFRLDDMRVYPSKRAPSVTRLDLAGTDIREYTTDISFNLDVRNFDEDTFKAVAQVKMTDRNENLVAQRSFDVNVPPGEVREKQLKLEPENLQVFLPPFRFVGELSVLDRPDLQPVRVDKTLVMGNSYLLFDDFSDVHGRWFLSGQPPLEQGGMFGEQQHADTRIQTAARISRVDAKPDADGESCPGRYAMQFDFTGRSTVFNGLHRFLPGDAYRMGMWVKGDGSGATLQAVVLDFSAPGGTFYTWKRTFTTLALCNLDFTGWQYVEVPLPGNGIGPRTPRGSTEAIDFPLDLASFVITPARKSAKNPEPKNAGTVLFGPIFVQTQQSASDSLSVQVAYDDEDRLYGKTHNAWVTVQNGWRVSPRQVGVNWALLDRYDEVIVRGRKVLQLGSTKMESFRVDLAASAAKILAASAPYRLQVIASDLRGGATEESQVIIARPDSVQSLAGFEADRGYLGLNAQPGAAPVARTATTQKHGGKRSLGLEWQKGQQVRVSVDPAMEGVPTEVSLWVHGDGSEVLFFPLIGDKFGVMSGVEQCQWDYFLPRTTVGELQNAVRVDWKGWKRLTFKLPPVPPGWNEALPVLPFVASYPLGLHLAIDARSAASGSGVLYVDDVEVRTHIEAEKRLAMKLDDLGESNLAVPGSDISVTVVNLEAPGAGAKTRTATVSGGIYDWRHERVSGVDVDVTLAPGAKRRVVIAGKVKPGAYAIRAELEEAEKVIASIKKDLLVVDAASLLGADWRDALLSSDRLRVPLKDRFSLIRQDWDWAEFQPGNLQVQTLLKMASEIRRNGQKPYGLLGYTTYWGSGLGYEDMQSGRLSSRAGREDAGCRDWGHSVDIFHPPERMDDWDNYTREMMRYAGKHLEGWLLWNSPDGGVGGLSVKPKMLADMVTTADGWRDKYCPDTPILIGGMSRNRAISYLLDLATNDVLDSVDGVNLRLDAGTISPEDGQVIEYIEDLKTALGGGEKKILITDLDWTVEKEGKGLDAFDQAAYLVRATLLLNSLSAEHVLMIKNEDERRLGFGLTYKELLEIPPMRLDLPAYRFKPAWLAMVRVRALLAGLDVIGEADVQDTVPGKTRAILYKRKSDGKPVAIVWRNNDDGDISFAGTGYAVESAEDILGGTVVASGGWSGVGQMPSVFVLAAGTEPVRDAMARLQARERGMDPSWPQRVLAAFTPKTGARQKYSQAGGTAAVFKGRTTAGRHASVDGFSFLSGGKESFEVNVPKDADLVLKKKFYLGEKGQVCEVFVNGKSQGTWNLERGDKDAKEKNLAEGIRESCFVVGRKALQGGKAAVEIRYAGSANTAGWVALACSEKEFPLSAFGPIHADSNVATPRIGRNVVGVPLAVGRQPYANGIGTFANCLLEYAVNGQFKRFTAEVGIDAATEGRGSVVFEVWADGDKVFNSPVMSGLDMTKKVDVDLTGVKRLRLTVLDGGDGNKFDAGDWCNPVLWLE
ncbi:MAG: NPCBM/NEW2 domain-containing protein [Lentisphaerae bacterium]|nr:NPCBM/NEW2 domain-containing protein [Lentisphaerota bacterium]